MKCLSQWLFCVIFGAGCEALRKAQFSPGLSTDQAVGANLCLIQVAILC